MKNFTTLVSTLLLALTFFCVNATAQTIEMYDVPIKATPLPTGDYTFSFDLNRDLTIHRQVRFVAPANVGFTIRPENNASPTQLAAGQSLTYTYGLAGEKTVRIDYSYYNPSPRTYVNAVKYLKFTVKSANVAYQSPDEIWTITTDQDFTPACESAAYPSEKPQKGFASVYIKYGTGHNNQLVRPIIFVDGVDFNTTTYTDPNKSNQIIRHGSTGWDVLTMGVEDSELDPDLENGQADYETFRQYPNAFQNLTTASAANGGDAYDILFIDFSNGADYIQRNSLLLQELIRRINQTKVANAQGNINKNVVLGASMGGQVARHALASMEKRGENHCTHTYVSFDSPQKGANIPLSIQAMGWFFNAVAAEDDVAQKSFWKKLSLPAPRQMLINHFGSVAQNGGVSILPFNWSDNINTAISGDFQCLRTEFVAEMAQLGYPKDTRNVAISCGSTLGNALANQGYSAGSELFDMHLGASSFGQVSQVQLYASGPSTLNFLSSPTGYYVKSRCNPSAGSDNLGMTANPSNVLFAGAVPALFNQYFLFLETPCSYRGITVKNNNPSGLNMDHVQGCKRRDLPSIKKLFKDFESSSVSFNLDEASYKRSFCFMPTMSTLDINWEMNQTNIERSINLTQIVPQGLTPFAAIYAPSNDFDNGKNLKHVEITSSMVTWLQGEMQIGETAGGATVVLPNANTQQVVFSKDGVISRNYTVNQNGSLSLTGDPSVKIGMGGCGNVQVNINSGGNFNIGSSTTVGQVTVSANSSVRIAEGGHLNLTNNSQLIIENGGRLIIETGANINLVGSESTIYVKNGGELVINGNMIFSGNGFFQFDAGHVLTLGTDLVLRGSGKTTRMIRLNASPQTTFNTLVINNRGFNLSNALIEYSNNRCRIDIMNDNTRLNVIEDATFMGSGNGLALNFLNISNTSIQRCNFNNLAQGITINSSSNLLQNVDIGQSNFSLVDCGITFFSPTWDNIPSNRSLLIHDCIFNYVSGNTVGTGTACRFQNMRNVGLRFERNTINGYREGNLWENITGIELKNTTIQIVGGLISNCRTGISAEKDMNNNILLHDGAELSNCEIGIVMVGGVTSNYENLPYGFVEMKCMRLINTGIVGIQGTDVELLISGYDGCGNNTFQNRGNGLLFDICYSNGTSNIEASHNFWVDGFRNMRFRLRTGVGGACSHANPRNLQRFSELGGKNFVINCNSRPTSTCGRTPLISDGNGTLSNGIPVNCLIASNTTTLTTSSANKSNIEKDIEAEQLTDVKHAIYPNPANETVNLAMPNGNYHLRVSNNIGQTIFAQNTEGVLSVDVATWANGIYYFELTDKATNKQQRSKIVVQH